MGYFYKSVSSPRMPNPRKLYELVKRATGWSTKQIDDVTLGDAMRLVDDYIYKSYGHRSDVVFKSASPMPTEDAEGDDVAPPEGGRAKKCKLCGNETAKCTCKRGDGKGVAIQHGSTPGVGDRTQTTTGDGICDRCKLSKGECQCPELESKDKETMSASKIAASAVRVAQLVQIGLEKIIARSASEAIGNKRLTEIQKSPGGRYSGTMAGQTERMRQIGRNR